MLVSGLRQLVESAVANKISNAEAFTTVDISHPLIADGSVIRHSEIRNIINDMWQSNQFGIDYTATPITVYPEPGKSATARLFHPDDPNFDISSYTGTSQQLVRQGFNPKFSSGTTRLNITDPDDHDSQILSHAVGGAKVQVQCEVQQVNSTLNVPRILLAKANFTSGNRVKVSLQNNSLKIERANIVDDADQVVDKEGRLRIYGPNLDALGKAKGQSCQTLLVEENGETYILIQ